MKRTIVLFGCAIGLVATTRAQLFIEAHGTYLLPIGGTGDSQVDMGANAGSDSQQAPAYSILVNHGRGAGAGLVVGGALSGPLGVELRLTYVSGAKQKWMEHGGYSILERHSTTTWTSSYFRVEPAMRFSTSGTSWGGYLAVGPSLALAPQAAWAYQESTVAASNVPGEGSTGQGEETKDYYGGMGYGAFGAMGLTWQSTGAFGCFAELQASALDWAPAHSDNVGAYTTTHNSGATSSYLFNTTTDFVNTVQPGQQDQATKVHLPMSTWGIRAGVRFTFGGASAAASTP